MKGVILYGPPASGKDTVTKALTEADPRCELFPRLKAGPGKADTYRLTTPEHIATLRVSGHIAWENTRYNAIYAVDTPELLERLSRGIPILHLGQVPAIAAIRDATPGALWLVVALWCARDLAERRLRARNPVDVAQRLQAWDQTEPVRSPDLQLDTGALSPSEAATAILGILWADGGRPSGPGTAEGHPRRAIGRQPGGVPRVPGVPAEGDLGSDQRV